MKKPVLEALQALLLHKSFTTYAEVASVAGVKKLLAVKVLNSNAALVIMDKKTGKITGLVDMVARAKNEAFANGITYIVRPKEPYFGAMIDIRNPKILAQVADCESYTPSERNEKFIKFTDANIEKLDKLGMVNSNLYKVPAFSTYWDE